MSPRVADETQCHQHGRRNDLGKISSVHIPSDIYLAWTLTTTTVHCTSRRRCDILHLRWSNHEALPTIPTVPKHARTEHIKAYVWHRTKSAAARHHHHAVLSTEITAPSVVLVVCPVCRVQLPNDSCISGYGNISRLMHFCAMSGRSKRDIWRAPSSHNLHTGDANIRGHTSKIRNNPTSELAPPANKQHMRQV